MICVPDFFADRDGTHAVMMHEEPYSPCRVYEDSQILLTRFTMCLVGTNPTLLQGDGEEMAQINSTEGLSKSIGFPSVMYYASCWSSVLVRTTFISFYFR